MKRFSEKVKDIVEVRSYKVLEDLLSEPGETISKYHFSDATADLMVQWLDEIGNTSPGRKGKAIAGFRGVGKSHFLATLSVIASHPEVRSLISEPYVSNASQRLLRRHYPVVNVRRGTCSTLEEEVSQAAAKAFDLPESDFKGSIEGTLETVRTLARDLRALVLIDTASDRSAPVERNDGEVLARISALCSEKGIFLGIALDDDIADAEGANLAVSQAFAIDYLDPEHLHKVVNSLIFPKRTRMQPILSGVFSYFRDLVPNFRWSEQRFSSLYPLHPATLDLAPFIRAYVPNFALLVFASEAGELIKGRPADSLIGFEEIFDNIETELRNVSELDQALEAYDQLVSKTIADLPVTERHQAKLILKTLFILSLNGKGSSADDIAHGMLLIDGSELNSARIRIESTLHAFSQELPKSVVVNVNGGVPEYSFKFGSNKPAVELAALASTLTENEIHDAYLRAVGGRFPEVADAIQNIACGLEPMELVANWRGTLRSGKVRIDDGSTESGDNVSPADVFHDWELRLRFRNADQIVALNGGHKTLVDWYPAPLTDDERALLAASNIIKSHAEFRAKYSDQLSAMIQTHARLVDKLIERTMIGDARLVIDGFDYNFSDAAREASSLGGMMSIMLEPLFETLYFEHPYFSEPLTDEVVDRFVSEVCGSSASEPLATARLAQAFGSPLGLVSDEPGNTLLRSRDALCEIEYVNIVSRILEDSGRTPTPIARAFVELSAPPYGLSRQAVRLILASMSATGLLEFVTAGNERFGGRSLDLKLDWNSIAAITSPSLIKAPTERLVRWAGIIADDESIKSLESPDDRSKILEALVEISAHWEKRNPMDEISDIPVIEFSTQVGRNVNQISENYAQLVATIDETLVGGIELASCIERISDKFFDRPAAFRSIKDSVAGLDSFANAFTLREKIRRYLAGCGWIEDEELLTAQKALVGTIDRTEYDLSADATREMGYAWEKFLRLYTDLYVSAHEQAQAVGEPTAWFESATGRERWRRFKSVFACRAVRTRFGKQFRDLSRRLKSFRCTDDPTENLRTSPTCSCSLDLATMNSREAASTEANRMIDEALWYFERLVTECVDEVRTAIKDRSTLISNAEEGTFSAQLIAFLDSGSAISDLTDQELDLLVAFVPSNEAADWVHSPGFLETRPVTDSVYTV